MKTVGIICAMNEEIEAMKNFININKVNKIYELSFLEGAINNINCIIVESGMGKVNAARSCQILIDNYKVDYIFNIGVAGGIADNLNVGDIVIATKLIQHDYDAVGLGFERCLIPNASKYFITDEYLQKIAINEIKETTKNKVRKGVVATGDIFVTNPNMSKKINKNYNALCVEMEGAAIAQVCYLCNIPFLTIRSISDVPNNNNKITFDEFLKSNTAIIANAMKKILDTIE